MTSVLAVDQGTTATKALLVSAEGDVEGFAAVPVARSYPRPGWVEQDPVELWESVLGAIRQLPSRSLAAMGVAAQRESVVVWDRSTGLPLTPCISWQCTRGVDICRSLREDGSEDKVRALSGLPLDAMFSASKLSSVLATDPSLRAKAEQGTACAGTVDSWLAWNLSGGELHVTDAGNASRTLLFDLETLAWSEELLELFRIPLAMLPAIVPSSGVLGMTKPQEGVPSTPLASLTADSHAALFGLGCSSPGKAKATYGTGTSLASPTGQERVRSSNGLATSVAWLMGSPTFALEGNVFSSGATVEWVSRLLGLASAADVEQLSRTTTGSGGVHLVPAFAGLGAPYWQPQARGQLSGMTFATGPAELARAAIESIAFQVSDLVAALEIDLGCPITELRVDGGATQNNALMQLQADLLGCPVVRTSVSDAAALGAAVMAGMATGVFDGPDLETMTRECEVIEPQIPESSRAELRAGWNDAVRHATVNCAGAAAS